MTTHTTAADRLLFDSYDKPEIAAVGCELDGLLAALITLLGGDMPPQLGRNAP